jgi:hypothetical protein
MYYLSQWHHSIQPQQCFHVNERKKKNQVKGLCHIQCHFHEKSVIFKQHTFDRIDCKYPSNYFDVVQIFVVFLLPTFYQFGKLQMLFGIMAKVPYKHCKKIQCQKPKVGLKRFVPQDLFDESYNAQY